MIYNGKKETNLGHQGKDPQPSVPPQRKTVTSAGDTGNAGVCAQSCLGKTFSVRRKGNTRGRGRAREKENWIFKAEVKSQKVKWPTEVHKSRFIQTFLQDTGGKILMIFEKTTITNRDTWVWMWALQFSICMKRRNH